MLDFHSIISLYGLQPHIQEGGWYSVTFDHDLGGAIYYLLGPGEFSCIHRIKVDEMWHFYDGSPLELYQFLESGKIIKTILGAGKKRQHLIKAGCWMAACPSDKNKHSFLGCNVWGKFRSEEVEYATLNQLLSTFPEDQQILKKFIRKSQL